MCWTRRFTRTEVSLLNQKRRRRLHSIVRLSFRPGRDFLSVLDETIGDEITARRAEGLLVRLEEESIVTLDEYVFIKTVLDRETRKFPDHYRGRVRASLLKAMLALLVRE